MPTPETGRVFPAGRPALVGHRGLGKGEVDGHRENTVASMLAALAAGVDWLEVDVTRTGDGSLVVHHNPALYDGRFLVEMSRAEAEAAGIVGLDALLDALRQEITIEAEPVLRRKSERKEERELCTVSTEPEF